MEHRSLGRRLLGGGLALLLTAALGLLVVVATPQNDADPAADQAPVTASPALVLESEDQLGGLIRTFPAPVLAASPGNALRLISGTSVDAAFEGSFGRVLTLVYEDADGNRIVCESIYPARALALLGTGDYHLGAVGGRNLAGMRTVRMENAGAIRLHAAGDEALYAVTVPRADSARLTFWLQPLQLFRAEE